MKDHIIFDTSSAITVEDTDSVGAYVRSGNSGALITHHALFKLPASPITFVDGDVTVGTETINKIAHNFRTGDLVQLTTTGVLPAGLALLTNYYVIRVDADNFKLASTEFNAEWAIAVDITAAAGGGTHTMTGITQNVRALDVFANLADGEGNKITSTGGALDVNIKTPIVLDTQLEGIYDGGTNTNPDNVGIIAHTRASSLTDTQQIERTSAAKPSVDNVDPDTVHALDVNAFGMMWDTVGTNWDRITGTSGNLNVNIAASNATVTVTDAALANTGIANAAKVLPVADTASATVTSILSNRKYLFVYNNDNTKVYVGAASVTAANGFPVSPGSYLELRAGASVSPFFIGQSGKTPEIRTLELS